MLIQQTSLARDCMYVQLNIFNYPIWTVFEII